MKRVFHSATASNWIEIISRRVSSATERKGTDIESSESQILSDSSRPVERSPMARQNHRQGANLVQR
jgi:hypothetical protein